MHRGPMSIKWTEKSRELGNVIVSINGRMPIVMRVRGMELENQFHRYGRQSEAERNQLYSL